MNASAQSLHLLESVYQGALRFITGSNHHCTLYSLAGPHWPYEWWFIGITLSINPFLAYCPIIYQSTCHLVPKLSQSQDCDNLTLRSWSLRFELVQEDTIPCHLIPYTYGINLKLIRHLVLCQIGDLPRVNPALPCESWSRKSRRQLMDGWVEGWKPLQSQVIIFTNMVTLPVSRLPCRMMKIPHQPFTAQG